MQIHLGEILHFSSVVSLQSNTFILVKHEDIESQSQYLSF